MAMSRQIFKSGKFSRKICFGFFKPLRVSNSGRCFFLRRPRNALYSFSDWGCEHCRCPPAAAPGCPVQVETGLFLQMYMGQGSHTLRDLLLFSHCVSSFSETKIRNPLEDHWKHWRKQLHLCWPHPATIQLQVGVSQRQATPWYIVLVMGSLQCVQKHNKNENFQKRIPFLPRWDTWIRSFRKGCRSNSIWSGKRWCHAGGCENAETWALCNHQSILSMYDSNFVTKLTVFVATPQQALTRRSGKPWCQSWKFSATSVTTTTSWICWAPALKEVMLLLRYNRQQDTYWPMPNPTLCVSLSQAQCWWSLSTAAMATFLTSCGLTLMTSWRRCWVSMRGRDLLSTKTWRPCTPDLGGAIFLRSPSKHLFYEINGFLNFVNVSLTQNILLLSDSGISCCSDYQEMQPILGRTQQGNHLDAVPTTKTHSCTFLGGTIHRFLQTDLLFLASISGEQPQSLSIGDLMRFSQQVAQGLDFLSTRNVRVNTCTCLSLCCCVWATLSIYSIQLLTFFCTAELNPWPYSES